MTTTSNDAGSPASAARELQPLAACIAIDATGKPSLSGFKCSHCAVVLLDRSRACPNCALSETLQPVALSERGKLYTYTIVHRSFPGIPTPFVSAVVALDGGGFVKGNLVRIEPDPRALKFDMPVRVEFERIERENRQQAPLLRYVFVPMTSARGGTGHE